MSWSYRLLVYAFPVPLWVVEYVMRMLAGEGRRAGEFFAPSLAAACIGLCLPICIPKTFSSEKFQRMTGVTLPPGWVIRSEFDSNLIPAGWGVAGLSFVAWACSLYAGIAFTSTPLKTFFDTYGIYVGTTIYALVVGLTELKERA